jgi:hypothetical protein
MTWKVVLYGQTGLYINFVMSLLLTTEAVRLKYGFWKEKESRTFEDINISQFLV